jgi:hypothetical protein
MVSGSGAPHSHPVFDLDNPEYGLDDRENEDLGSSCEFEDGDDRDESDDETFLALYDMYDVPGID